MVPVPRALALAILLAVPLAGCSKAPPPPAATDAGLLELHGLVVTQAIVPLANAAIRVMPGGYNATTDAKGLFTVGPLAPGSYQVLVRADGYADQTVAAQAGGDLVKVVMAAVRTDVPYIELEKFEGYLACTFDSWAAGFQILGAPCVGIVDLVTGVNASTDVWQFRFDVAAPGLRGILAEMVWDPQATGTDMGMLLRNVAGAGSGVDAGGTNVDTQYASARGKSPLRLRVLQGVENPGADDGAAFQVPQDQSMSYKLLVLGRADYNKTADVQVMVQNTPQVFLTKFYNAMGDPSYTVLDG